MKSLIIEDEETTRIMLEKYIEDYGKCDLACDGKQGYAMFRKELENGNPYNLICMDIMMPAMDGQETLRKIRSLEKEKEIKSGDRVKVIMTTALEDQKNVTEAFLRGEAASYIVKPISKKKLLREIRKLGMIE